MSKKFKIVFLGTPDFAVASLDALINAGHEICAVVTAVDKPAGRGQKIQTSAVKEYALSKGLKVLQPGNLKDESFLNELKSFKHDLQIVVAFRMLPKSVWSLPPMGTFNVHASLLPKYRGAAPINWAIINGEKESGVTVFKLSHQIDTGEMLLQEKVLIDDNMNAGQLHDILMSKGADLIVKALSVLSEENRIENRLIPQDESLVTHAPKLYKETCRINWNESQKNIHNLVRGLSPYPTAFTLINFGEQEIVLKVFASELILSNSSNFIPGTIITDNKSFIHVHCNDGLLALLDLQLQGKKRMNTKDFLNGFKFEKEYFLK
ncbi:MAG: methionyl-tRNA formyltransferase [Bacteroidia bacterium]